jgi:hypothetical protein
VIDLANSPGGVARLILIIIQALRGRHALGSGGSIDDKILCEMYVD